MNNLVRSPFEGFRFKVEESKYRVENKKYTYPAVVLKHEETGLVVASTDYADLLIYKRYKDSGDWNCNRKGLYAVCELLNYILIDHTELNIFKIEDITLEAAQNYLDDYCSTRITKGEYPRKDTCQEKRDAISRWLYRLCKEREKNEDLPKMNYLKSKDILVETIFCDNSGRNKKQYIYTLFVKWQGHSSGLKQLERDMPIILADRLIAIARVYDPEIAFAIALQRYMGLREGEVVNVRMWNSTLGPGVIYKTDGESCYSFEVDMTNEYVLRSDGVDVGDIKTHNRRQCYSEYLNDLWKLYKEHLKLVEHKNIEDTRPMFSLSRKSRATGFYYTLTKATYIARVKQLFDKYLLPTCELDPNDDVRMFYESMKYHTWGPHAFRHVFSVDLVLRGCDEVQLQTFRGDLSIESARAYLKNKGAFRKLFVESAERTSKMLKG